MPEGPEVKCRADVLTKTILGYIIVSLGITEKSRYRNKKPVIPHEAKIDQISTHGKLTFFHTSNYVIKIHYMMEGRFQFSPGPHSDLWFDLLDPCSNPIRMYFDDTRHFGTIEILSMEGYEKCINKLGPDPLNPKPDDLERFVYGAKKKGKWQVCKFLLDQSVMSGVGNYLKSEILFNTRVSPKRIVSDLTSHELMAIFSSAQKIARNSYNMGGCFIRTYISGTKINYSSKLKVYGQKMCDSYTVRRDTFSDQRTTHWVPELQP